MGGPYSAYSELYKELVSILENGSPDSAPACWGISSAALSLQLFWEEASTFSNFIMSPNGIGPAYFHFEICVLIATYFLFISFLCLYKGLSLVVKVHMEVSLISYKFHSRLVKKPYKMLQKGGKDFCSLRTTTL